MLIRRFLAFLPWKVSAESGRAARVVSEFSTRRGYRTITNGYVFAYEEAEEASKASPMPPAGQARPRVFLQVLPGAVAPPVSDEVRQLAPDFAAWEEYARKRLQFFNLVELGPGTLQISGDILGVMPSFQAELEDGIVLSSSIHDLLSCFPELVRPLDPLGLAQRLAGAGCMGTRTLHDRIRRPQLGKRLKWGSDTGARTVDCPRLAAPRLDPEVSASDAIDRIISAVGQSMSGFLDGSEQVVLPLSGGFDSRLIGCIGRSLGIELDAITLGYPQHTEAKVARRIARLLELEHQLLPPRNDLLDRIDLWLEGTEGQGGYGSLFATDFLDRGYPLGTPFLHGMVGNPLSGSYTRWIPQKSPLSRKDAVEAIVAERHQGFRPDYTTMLGLPVTWADFEAEVDRFLPETPAPNQAVVLWSLENRTRQSEAAMILYMGLQYRVGGPFYDPEVVNAWLCLPRAALDGRALLRTLFDTCFPEVAQLPHSEEMPTRLPRNWQSVSFFGDRIAGRLWKQFRRKLTPGYKPQTKYWSSYVKMRGERRKTLMGRIDEKRDALSGVLDWDPEATAGPEFWNAVTTTHHRAERVLRTYYLLTEYCDWLRRTIPGV